MNQNSRHKIGNNGKVTKDKIHQKIGYDLAEVRNRQHFLTTCIMPKKSEFFSRNTNLRKIVLEFSTQGQFAMWFNAMKFFRSCLFFFHKILKREYYYHYTFKGQFLGPPPTSQYVLIAGSLIFSYESCFTLRSST